MANTSTRSFGIVTSLTGLTAGICVNSLDTNETVETAEARNESPTSLATASAGKSPSLVSLILRRGLS